MPSPSKTEIDRSIRFVTLWTVINGGLLAVGVYRAVAAGLGTEPGVGVGFLGLLVVMTAVGLWRIRQLQGLRGD